MDTKLNSALVDMNRYRQRCHDLEANITKLRTELAAAQADNARLRNGLLNLIPLSKVGNYEQRKEIVAAEALATNSPDDALKEYGAKLVESIAELWGDYDHGFIRHILREDADKIRKGEF